MKLYEIKLESILGLDSVKKEFNSWNEAWDWATYSYKTAIQSIVSITLLN